MRKELQCIFPRVYRIPADCGNRSIFKCFLEESPKKLLEQVAKSQVTYLSPFDSAAILNKLIETSGNKRITELRRDPLYRPVATKVVESVERYRQELLAYFLNKFYKLHDIQAIKALARVFVRSGAVRIQNINQLIELLYHLAHHIPKELHIANNSKEELGSDKASDKVDYPEHVEIYWEFVRQLQEELTTKVAYLKDTVLLYKLVTSLSVLPKTEHTEAISKTIKGNVKVELEKNSWNHKQLKRVIIALTHSAVVDHELLKRIISALELNQDSFDSHDIIDILEALGRFNIQSSDVYMSLQDKLQINKHIKEAILSLSKTHPLFQSDKVTLSPEAASLIANTVEFRIKQIIQISQRFMIKSCRYVDKHPTLMPSDLRDALRTLRMENIDGYSNCYDYRYVISSKLYKGNRVVKCESTLKNSMDERCWGRQKLTDIVARDMQKAIPAQPGLSVHWMLVNGQVPALSSNMAVCITDEFKKEAKRQMVSMSMGSVNFFNSDDASKQLDEIEQFASKIKLPMSLESMRSDNTLDKSIVDSLQLHLNSASEGPVDKNPEDKSAIMPKVLIPKVEHILTKEQRFFLKEIKNIVKRASVSMDHQAQVQLGKVLSILRNSPALDQLLPELSFFFVSELERTTGDMEPILKFSEALSANANIQLHFHVHQLVAPLLNIALRHDDDQELKTVHHNLCLRKLATKTLGNIANNLRSSKAGLEGIDQYLMTLYKRAIVDDNCSITVLYGAMCGISRLPLGARRIIFFPLVPLIMSALYKKHVQSHENYSKNGSKAEEFKFLTCQEILHMAMVMLYDACFEDIVECIQDTGVFSISHEAQVMIEETLSGCIERAVDPESFFPVYLAIISRCFDVLKPPTIMVEKKETKVRPPELEIAELYAKVEQERQGKKRRTIEVERNNVDGCDHADAAEKMGIPWYIPQATHSMTLTI